MAARRRRRLHRYGRIRTPWRRISSITKTTVRGKLDHHQDQQRWSCLTVTNMMDDSSSLSTTGTTTLPSTPSTSPSISTSRSPYSSFLGADLSWTNRSYTIAWKSDVAYGKRNHFSFSVTLFCFTATTTTTRPELCFMGTELRSVVTTTVATEQLSISNRAKPTVNTSMQETMASDK